MTTKNEDDFWNTSSSSTFNFDDDDESCLDNNSDYVFNPAPDEISTLPIHSVISNECLTLILDDIKSTMEYVVPPLNETIRKMFHGQRFVLQVYRTLEDKLLLLDSALETWDGNVIIAVIIFLRASLKGSIFFNNLSKRKMAVKHYANYLLINNNWQELADLYMVTGNASNMKDLYYLLGKDATNQQSLYKKLEQFSIDHSMNFSSDDKFDVYENLVFLKWQIENKETSHSIIDQLAALCKKEWERSRGDENITEFKKQFKIDDYQYEWTVMNVTARLGLWKKMISIFIKPNWLTKKVALKSVIRQDLFVVGLCKHKPPIDVVDQFLQCVTDGERSLDLAQKMEAHKFVINYYISQRDRTALLNYRDHAALKPEEILLINNALQATDKKWKN